MLAAHFRSCCQAVSVKSLIGGANFLSANLYKTRRTLICARFVNPMGPLRKIGVLVGLTCEVP